jgi:hypothetical protein
VTTVSLTPPYALEPLSFRFAALAALAGRAPIGGQREVALATYVVARLAHDAAPTRMLPLSVRAERAAAARNWLASVTLPQAVRPPLVRVIDRSAGESATATAAAVRSVISVTASYLNPRARLELAALADLLESQAVAG